MTRRVDRSADDRDAPGDDSVDDRQHAGSEQDALIDPGPEGAQPHPPDDGRTDDSAPHSAADRRRNRSASSGRSDRTASPSEPASPGGTPDARSAASSDTPGTSERATRRRRNTPGNRGPVDAGRSGKSDHARAPGDPNASGSERDHDAVRPDDPAGEPPITPPSEHTHPGAHRPRRVAAASGRSAAIDRGSTSDRDDVADDDVAERDTTTTTDASAIAARSSRRRRVSRWDRPKPPHDWRFYVGMLGRTLIVIGILMFGFVGYQLWGTGIATARAQDRLANEFDERIAAAGTAAPDATEPPASIPDSTAPTTTPAPSSTVPGATTPPTSPEPPSTSIVPVEQDIPPIVPGEAIARLEIPRMGKDGDNALHVVPGVDLNSLQDGPGHFPDTPLPGQLGNAAIAGHRTTWGEPFARIDELQPGDEIIVTMLTGDRFVYEVASTEIVSPNDYYVVQTTDPTVAELTLMSCHPRWSAKQRIAVHAFLVPDASAPVGTPTFYDLEANDGDGSEQVTSDDPTVRPPAVATPGAETTDVAGTADDTTPTDTGAGTDDGGAIIGPSGPDALTAGWFHDPAAWPQIALWGAICAAIAVAAYAISRRFKNYAIGWSIAIVPFVIALYFLYENVNRLLPPGL